MASKSNHSIKFSAPAKIHIIGEHTAVYGKPTIVSAINQRLSLVITSGAKQSLNKDLQKLQAAIEDEIKKAYKKKIPPYSFTFDSEFPLGSGLGGSAAISATLTAALLTYLKVKFTPDEVYKIAIAGEKAIHGFPSGSDLAAVVFGGNIWYRKDLPNLKLIQPLPFKIQENVANFALIDSGKPEETTKEMVQNVVKWSKSHKPQLKKILDDQEELTRQMAQVLENGDRKELVRIIKAAHRNLVRLGVVSKSAQKIAALVEKAGGAAKITGAGGYKNGSGMIIVYHEKPEKLKKFKPIPINLSGKGLQLEQ